MNHHSDFVEAMAYIYRPSTYVELGLYEGETFNKAIKWVGEGHGVDLSLNRVNLDMKYINRAKLYEMSTDTFFEKWEKSIDMAFIDADHNWKSARTDLENILKYLSPGGVVLIHDTDPMNEKYREPGLCGDSYKLVDILEMSTVLNITTIPLTEAGLSIITRKGESRSQLFDKKKSFSKISSCRIC